MQEIKNFNETVERIKRAVLGNERIILYSDADLDGVASLIILEEAIKNLGGNVACCYFPDREQEGYGLSEMALDYLKHLAPGLLILSDCGIGNTKEVAMANKLGFEVIIVDHHEILPQIPPALLIVDPKQELGETPTKILAACGLCLKLGETLIQELNSKKVLQGFYELAALGTIADMMPQENYNQGIIERGLDAIKQSERIGIKVFYEFYERAGITNRELANKIINVLQLTDFSDHLTESYIFLNSADLGQAKIFLQKLFEKNQARKQLLESFEKEIADRTNKDDLFIFDGGQDIPQSLSGGLASRIFNRFNRPVFVYAGKNGISRGSVRAPKGINVVKAMEGCSDFLITYGGHPQAAGFSVKNKDLKKFQKCLKKYFRGKN